MTILSLNHYTIRTTDWERSRRFYEEVVGLRSGERPPFDFPGYWLYAEDGNPVLHLVGIDAAAAKYLGAASASQGGGAIDHIAFLCADHDAVKQRLDRLKIAHDHRTVPLIALRQLFLHDPDGIKLELNFPV
jgi:catechol 2,3-dioxygenase-like lactoylglutathione lyase family enzyme